MKLFPYLCFAVMVLAALNPLRAAERQVLRGHIPAVVANQTAIGRMGSTERMDIAIGLPLRDQAGLNKLLQELANPASANYRRFLTPEQFAEMFGPTKEDYQAVIQFAEANGLTVTATHPNRVVLSVSGDVAAIERAFQIRMQVYRHPREGRNFHAPDKEPTLDLAVPILRISGLDDYSLPKPMHRIKSNITSRNSVTSPRTPTLSPGGGEGDSFAGPAVQGGDTRSRLNVRSPGEAEDESGVVIPNAGSGPGGAYRGNDFRAAYAPGTPLTGYGQSVGLLQFDGFYANDIASYVSQAGLPTIPIVVVPIDGGVSTPGGGNGEVALDIEMAMSMAPGLSKIYVYEAPNPSPWVDLLSRMANDNLSKQLSCSWGGGGPDPNAEQIFQQMAAQGQSFFNASGDSDAFTSSIQFPADSPNITQVGGTTLTTTGPGGAYVSETAWNWGLQNGNYVGTSGGVSTFYAIPSYQVGINMTTNLGSTTMRNVPDVALTGDGIYVVYNNGSSGTFGGTSCAAPLWAGFMALVNQQAAVGSNPPVGFINPIVYGIGKTNANYATIFHDTTTGNNFSAQSPTKYPAVPAYDLCTGWGTPNGSSIINLLTPPVSKALVVSAGWTLAGENCLPTNNAVDPGETVTLSVALLNVGTINTTNLMVTLLATNGVTSPGGAQNYGAVVAGGAGTVRAFTFTANGSCGGTITPTFQLQDGATNLGMLAVSVPLGAASMTTVSMTNATALTIGNSGPASVFPSMIAVSGITDTVTKVTVTLQGLNHTMPDDLDILLVGPAGQKLMLMSDAGGGGNLNGVVLTFDDSATAALSDGGQLTSGTWLPSNYGSVDGFSAPAPAGPYDSTLSIFNGQDPNGNWALYIQDDRNPNGGSLAQGWSLNLTTVHRVCCDGAAPLANLAIGEVIAPTFFNVGSNVTFTISVTNLGPDSASNGVVSDVLPAGVNLVSANSSQGTVSNSGNTLTCALGTFTNGAVATISITGTATTAGARTNVVTASSSTTDADPANNIATATFTVNGFPTITAIANQTTNEDASLVVGFTIADPETIPPFLTVTRTSSNTNLVPVTNIVFSGIGGARTMTITPLTNAFGATTITITVSDGMASATSSFVLTVTPVNDAPTLAGISNRTIYELTTLVFTNQASDVESNALTFRLGVGAPTNALIDANSGVFSWTPTEAQGPSTNVIGVIVTDNGAPSLSATQAFTVVVLETNAAPTLAVITDKMVYAGALIEFTNVAADADVPTNTLAFTLEAGAPTGAVVNAASGVFTWQTSEADAGTTNSITVKVTDNGQPNLSASRSFVATVLAQPVIVRPMMEAMRSSNALILLKWNSVSGQTYRVQTKVNLEDTNWSDILPDVVASGTNTSRVTVPGSPVQQFYRVMVVE